MFTLKQHLDSTRQELSQALYQNDAACRVIARLLRDKEELNAHIQELHARLANAPTQPEQPHAAAHSTAMDEEVAVDSSQPLNEEVISRIDETRARLSQARKKRQIPAEFASADQITQFSEIATHTLHSTTKPGVCSCDVFPGNDELVRWCSIYIYIWGVGWLVLLVLFPLYHTCIMKWCINTCHG